MLRELGRTKGIKLGDSQIRQKAEVAHKAVGELVTGVSLRQSMGADVATFRVNEDTGHIEQCGIVHGALTPTPADNKNPLVRFKSALDYVYNLEDTSKTFAFPNGTTDATYAWNTDTGTVSSATSVVPNITINVNPGIPSEPVKAVTPVIEATPESTMSGDTPKPDPSRQNKDVNTMKAKNKQQTRLAKMSPEEDELLRSELHSVVDGVLNSIGMQATDEEVEEYVDEMEENLEKQDEVTEGGVVEVAAEAIAEDLGTEVEADMPITQEIVEEIVEENLEEILPEEVKAAVKAFHQRAAKAQARGKKYGELVANGVKANTPTRSKKSQVGGFGQKAFNHVNRTEAPSLGGMVKSIVERTFKAQNPYIGNLGGYLVGQEVSQNLLAELRPQVVMFDAGVKQTTVSNIGVYTVPKMTTAPTAYRPGINQEVTDADGEFDTITAYLRPIAARCKIPIQLLKTSAIANIDALIREEMIKSIRLQIDKEILFGTGTVVNGTGAEIRGILSVLEGHNDLSTSNVVTLATNGRVPNYTDLINAETQVLSEDVELMDASSGWVMHPRTRGTFRSLTTTTGEPLLFDNYGQKPYQEMIGYTVHKTTQIPTNITAGSSSDTSYIFFGEYSFGEYVMANDIEIIVDEFTFAKDLQVQIIAYTFSDFIIHYPEAFYVMKGVRSS
jgi:HK97 family phage major capsid protein